MSSFLKKLKEGGVTVDNNTAPDNTGAIVRKLEKHYASEPVENLGIQLSEDAEVLSVAAGSPADRANIPERYMVYEVNNEFVENREQFREAASKNLNLVIKLQSVTGVAELIAKVLQNEDARATNENIPRLDLDELFRTTPRYNFLSGEHPLFRRYMRRLSEKREATALIKQRTREAQEQQKRDMMEKMRKELEAAEAEKKLADERRAKEAELLLLQTTQKEKENSEPFIKVVEDESTFGCTTEEAIVEAKEVDVREPEIPNSAPEPVSAMELLALVGIPTLDAPHQMETGQIPVLTEVCYTNLPSEKYTLRSGEKVVCVLKSRSGPIPIPPPGKPPKISRAARHITRDSPIEPPQPLAQSKPLVYEKKERRSQEVCREYTRGHCTRGARCSMRHISPDRHNRGRRRRSDSREHKRRRRDSSSRDRRRYRSRSRDHGRRRRH